VQADIQQLETERLNLEAVRGRIGRASPEQVAAQHRLG
jgi:hypothetical protein